MHRQRLNLPSTVPHLAICTAAMPIPRSVNCCKRKRGPQYTVLCRSRTVPGTQPMWLWNVDGSMSGGADSGTQRELEAYGANQRRTSGWTSVGRAFGKLSVASCAH